MPGGSTYFLQEETKIKIKFKEPKEAREDSPAVIEPFVSKSYNQVYDQIWKDIAKKEVGKV